MLGEFSKPDDDGPSDQSSTEAIELTRFFMVAPIAGTVEQRNASDAQRVEAGTLLFVVANTDELEVSAAVREGDWQKVSPYLRDGEGKPLKVSVPAFGEDREFEATIDYVGRFVDDQNKAVPLVAILDNSRQEMVPGIFAWIKIPAGDLSNELVVSPAAAAGDRSSETLRNGHVQGLAAIPPEASVAARAAYESALRYPAW